MSTEYISWIQLTVTGALLGAFFFLIRTFLADLKEKFNEKFESYKTYTEKQLLDVRKDTEKELGHMEKNISIAHQRITEAQVVTGGANVTAQKLEAGI